MLNKNLKISLLIIVILIFFLGCLIPIRSVFVSDVDDKSTLSSAPSNVDTSISDTDSEDKCESSLGTFYPNEETTDEDPDSGYDSEGSESDEEINLDIDVPTFTEPSIDPEIPEEPSDIIDDLEIHLYNDYADDFNLIDGAKYLNDIATLLQKYAPEGLRISAGCAMAYTEGGSGKKGIYAHTNNCFGIRAYASWEGYVYARSTGKVYKDYATAVAYGANDFFRAYRSMEESVQDYVRLMTSSYYGQVINAADDAGYFNYVLAKGYGEAHLSSTWLYVVDLYELTQYNGYIKDGDIYENE